MICRIYFFLFFTSFIIAQTPFKIGESLQYHAEFNRVRVGEAELKVSAIEEINTIKSYHIIYVAKTKGLADRLFKIRDQIDIWIDKEGFFTHRLIKNINQGNYKNKVDVRFDYNKSIAKTSTKEISIDFKARDSFSLFYYLRTILLKENDIMSFSSFEGRRIVDYKLQIKGNEIIRTELGNITCTVIRPYQEGGNLFKNQGDMQIWISNDEKRLPVKIQIKMKFGSMTLLLKKVSY